MTVGKFFANAIALVVIIIMSLIAFGAVIRTPQSDLLFEARRAVESQLKDSSSAEFKEIGVYQSDDGSLTACGNVNGKNSFGAMAGYKRFFYKNGVVVIEERGAESLLDEAWAKYCHYNSRSSSIQWQN